MLLLTRPPGCEVEEQRAEVRAEGSKAVYITKQIAGDVGVERFWLTNRQPDLWRVKKEVEVTDNRDLATRILEARRRTKGLAPGAGIGDEQRVSGDVLAGLGIRRVYAELPGSVKGVFNIRPMPQRPYASNALQHSDSKQHNAYRRYHRVGPTWPHP